MLESREEILANNKPWELPDETKRRLTLLQYHNEGKQVYKAIEPIGGPEEDTPVWKNEHKIKTEEGMAKNLEDGNFNSKTHHRFVALGRLYFKALTKNSRRAVLEGKIQALQEEINALEAENYTKDAEMLVSEIQDLQEEN